jgi:hypothetical protein
MQHPKVKIWKTSTKQKDYYDLFGMAESVLIGLLFSLEGSWRGNADTVP